MGYGCIVLVTRMKQPFSKVVQCAGPLEHHLSLSTPIAGLAGIFPLVVAPPVADLTPIPTVIALVLLGVDALAAVDVGHHKVGFVYSFIFLGALKVEEDVFLRLGAGGHVPQVTLVVWVKHPLLTTGTLPLATLVFFHGPVLPLQEPLALTTLPECVTHGWRLHLVLVLSCLMICGDLVGFITLCRLTVHVAVGASLGYPFWAIVSIADFANHLTLVLLLVGVSLETVIAVVYFAKKSSHVYYGMKVSRTGRVMVL
jgi:hypothetical protein